MTEHNTPDPCPACGGTGERRVEIPFGWYLADCSACDGLGVVS